MSAALIIDIVLWGSVAAVGFIALQRGRLVLTSSVREGAWTSSTLCRASRSA
jgi:hypothetical protein